MKHKNSGIKLPLAYEQKFLSSFTFNDLSQDVPLYKCTFDFHVL